MPDATDTLRGGHDHPGSELSDVALRVRALESLLVDKGLVDSQALDLIVEAYETRIGPHNGARVVARAWVDPDFRQRLLADASEAVLDFDFDGPPAAKLVALENTGSVHNLVVCTLCSCYPVGLLGLPPVWYKAAPYQSRAVIDPRGVLAEFGLTLPPDTEVRVWDSTSEVRYVVLPERPAETAGWTENDLAAIVTRDSMVGVAKVVPLAFPSPTVGEGAA